MERAAAGEGKGFIFKHESLVRGKAGQGMVEVDAGKGRHVDWEDNHFSGGGILQRGEQAPKGALVGNVVEYLAGEEVAGGGISAIARGDEERGAGPLVKVEKVLKDGLAGESEMGLGNAHAERAAAGEDGEGDRIGWHEAEIKMRTARQANQDCRAS